MTEDFLCVVDRPPVPFGPQCGLMVTSVGSWGGMGPVFLTRI